MSASSFLPQNGAGLKFVPEFLYSIPSTTLSARATNLHEPVHTFYGQDRLQLRAVRLARRFPQAETNSETRIDQASTAQYTPQSNVTPALSNSNTPQSEYSLNSSSARPAGYVNELLTRQPYQPAQPAPLGSMAQAASPSMTPQDGGEKQDHHSANRMSMKSNSDVPIDPTIAQQTSPAYPPPYSPYQGQPGHEMPHYAQGQPPAMYRQNHPEWPPGHYNPMQGPYSGPGPNVSSASPATASSRQGQVCLPLLLFFVVPRSEADLR